jgi:hypothetical protein
VERLDEPWPDAMELRSLGQKRWKRHLSVGAQEQMMATFSSTADQMQSRGECQVWSGLTAMG